MKKVKIFDEENSIVIDDQYTTNNFEFFPKDKKFEVSSSIKDDVFYNYQTYQYKISADPIVIYIKLLESSHEPPKEYSVKDGVVLESEIKKENSFLRKDHLTNLKKQVEWNKVNLLDQYEVSLFILSKHPEIISKEDYRKFLRQSIEKIKLGVSKVEEALKEDTQGLKIYISEYGYKSVWYKPSNKLEEKEIIEYWKLSEEKRLESNYGKKFEYAEKLNKSLFTDDSSKYVGISEYEFKISTELLEYIEKLLDKKETITAEKEEAISQQNNNINKIISVLMYLLTVFFIILKLTDGIDWNWLAVISPVLIWEGFGFVLRIINKL